MVLGAVLVAISLVILTIVSDDTNLPLWILALTLFGLGHGLVSPLLVTAAQSAVGPRQIGVATSAVSFFRGLGGTVGSAVGAAVLTHTVSDQFRGDGLDLRQLSLLPDQLTKVDMSIRSAFGSAYADAASIAFLIAAIVAGVCVVLVAALPEAQSADQYASEASTNAAAPTSPAS
jgi:MFS family permease